MIIASITLFLFILFSSFSYSLITIAERGESNCIKIPSNTSPYADAKCINDLLINIKNGKLKNDSGKALIVGILSKYCQRGNITVNPLLSELLTEAGIKIENKMFIELESPEPNNTEVFGGNTSLSQGEIIKELVNIVSTRVKDESMYFALTRLFSLLESQSRTAVNIKALLPRTMNLMQKLKDEGEVYPSDLAMLQLQIQADLGDFVQHSYMFLPENNPSLVDRIHALELIYNSIKRGESIYQLAFALSREHWNDNRLSGIFNLYKLILNGLKSGYEIDSPMITQEQFAELDPKNTEKEKFIKWYYGLVLLQVQCLNDNSINEEIEFKDKDKCINNIYNLMSIYNENNKIIEYQNKIIDLKTPDRIQNEIILVKEIFKIMYADRLKSASSRQNIASIESDINWLVKTQNQLKKKNYKELSALIIDRLTSDPGSDLKEIRKAMLLFQLATIKEGDSIEQILLSTIEPIGSSTRKRNSTFDISLNGYAGLNIIYEEMINSGYKGVPTQWMFGVTAPLGLSFSLLPTECGSLSLIMQGIDLGSLVNYQFNNKEVKYSDITFADVWAPGIGLAFNIKGTPFTISYTHTFVNNLRTFSYSENGQPKVETDRNVKRDNISFLIDIPFITLFNIPK